MYIQCSYNISNGIYIIYRVHMSEACDLARVRRIATLPHLSLSEPRPHLWPGPCDRSQLHPNQVCTCILIGMCGGGCTMRSTPKSWTGSDIERQMVRQMVEDAQYSNCLSLERRLQLARRFRKAVPVAFLCLWLLYGVSCVYLEYVQSVICTSKEDREYWGSLGKNFV